MNRIRNLVVPLAALLLASAGTSSLQAGPAEKAAAISNYFSTVFHDLGELAGKDPTPDSFRTLAQPFVTKTDGVFGATWIDTNFVIRQVYFKRDFLAVGFDLKKVSELSAFWTQMREKPAPQLSEPGHGNLIQPRLIAVRYPILINGQFKGIVSAMIHTKSFLKAVGLDQCPAYSITCLGKVAETKGHLPPNPDEIQLDLPSTKWVIQYQE
jgi:hypothetical protein